MDSLKEHLTHMYISHTAIHALVGHHTLLPCAYSLNSPVQMILAPPADGEFSDAVYKSDRSFDSE